MLRTFPTRFNLYANVGVTYSGMNIEKIAHGFHYLPTFVKIMWGLAPKLVAISMGWMVRENMMSARARAMMKTSIGPIFLLRSFRTKMTSRLRMQLTKTAFKMQ